MLHVVRTLLLVPAEWASSHFLIITDVSFDLCEAQSRQIQFLAHTQTQTAVSVFGLIFWNEERCLRNWQPPPVPLKYWGVEKLQGGRDSSFGIATRYGLDSPGIEYRWWAIFSVSVQTGPEAHPTPCTMVTGPFTGVKRPGGVVLTAHPRLQCRGLK